MKGYFKSVIATVLCYLMIVSMIPTMALTSMAASYTGSGTEASPYVVSNATELTSVLSLYNTEGVYIKLDNNITLPSTYVPGDFNANLDGDFYKITGSTQFFTTNKGALKNFYYTCTETIVEGSGIYAGIVCDSNSGTISGVIAEGYMEFSCYHSSTSDIDDPSEIGIIAGYNSGTIINCGAFGSISADCEYGAVAGGIAAKGGNVYNCYVSATVIATGSSRYGSSKDNAISTGTFTNSYFNSELYTDYTTGGYTASEMKTQSFVDMLNNSTQVTDSEWIRDTSNKNSGFPILKRALNCEITSSKTNLVISGSESITLTGSDSAATIYYTTNGTTPTTSSSRYTGAITLTDDVTIKAIAYKGGIYSKPVTFSYCKPDGAGTKENPYKIDSSAAFFAISELGCDAHYVFTKNITLDRGLTSIEKFYGSIDGRGYSLKGVYADSVIFGLVKENYGVIENINIEVKENTEFLSSAGFVGKNYGVVYNCNFFGNLNSKSLAGNGFVNHTGGIVSYNSGRLEKCSFSGNIYSECSSYAGGVVGYNDGDVLYCEFDGEVDIYSIYMAIHQGYVGGFVGYASASSSIKYCHANATRVHSAPRNYAGVIVGCFIGNSGSGTIEDCTVVTGDVSYDYFYTEFGTNSVNYYTGETVLGYKPEAHAHDFEVVIREPECYAPRKADCFCSCGVGATAEWYDDWWQRNHYFGDNGYELAVQPTCTETGEARKYCIDCVGYDYITVPATDHFGYATLLDKSLYPESAHNYSNYLSETKTISHPGAACLKLVFNYQTYVESDRDYIYIYDKDGKLVGKYTGSELQNQTISVEGDTAKITLSTNASYTYYGYSLNAVFAYGAGDVLVDSSLYPESAHSYGNYLNETKTFTYPNATSLKVTFSSQTETESTYDYIYLYDGSGKSLGTYTGTGLANKTIEVSGDTLKIKLTSDGSSTKYGYSISSIYATVSNGYGEWSTTKQPTCVENGEKERVCAICDYVDVASIDALGHSFTNYVSDNNATYTADGTKTAKCDRCDVTNTITEIGTKLTPVSIAVTTMPTNVNYRIGQSVSITGLIFTATYADGGTAEFTHSYAAVTASSTEVIGKSSVVIEYMGISTTFDIFVHDRGNELIDPAVKAYPESAHNYANSANETKTFTYSGATKLTIKFNSSTFVESNCDYIYIYNKSGTEIGKYTGSTLAGKTITIEGDTFKIKLTSDYSVTKYGYKLDAIYADTGLYHPEVIDEATVTCTENGLSQGSHCEICGMVITPQVETDALGHSFTNYTPDGNSTCEGDGTKTAKCDRCDVTDTIADEGSATGHTYSETVTEPTCTDEGYTTYTCACGYSYDDNYVDALGHAYGDWYEIEAPTCDLTGLERRDCENCSASETQAIETLPHDAILIEGEDATCTVDGITAFVYCGVCGSIIEDQIVIPALGHSFTNYTYDGNATCLEDGTKTAKCDRCDVTDTIADEGSATGHNYDANVTEPTCTEQGYTTYVCTCGDSYVDDYVDALGHSFTNYTSDGNATCLEDGTKTAKCDGCDLTDTLADEGSATGHIYDAAVTAPTCTEQGYTTYTCACGDSYVGDYVRANGHRIGEWYEYKAATCEARGEMRSNCKNCEDYFVKRETAALGHDLTYYEAKDATCTEEGHNAYEECSRCDHTTYESIPVIEHSYEQGACTMCGEADPSAVSGDINGDGKLNISDFFTLKNLLLAGLFDDPSADIDKNGKLNISDLFALKQLLR